MSTKTPSKYENEIVEGDSLHILKQLDNDSIDSIVTDPPYGYSFMNKDWDKAVVSVDVWKECLRVLKPGAFAFIMSSPRQDVLCKMTLNLIDAGFETNFTSIYWTYASGFPKAANTFKLLQKREINKEELNGSYAGFQPKPALETILVVMKPLSEKSFVDQALKNGKGVTWLDDCRIPYEQDCRLEKGGSYQGNRTGSNNKSLFQQGNGIIDYDYDLPKGRFPANLVVSDDALNNGFQKGTKPHPIYSKKDKYEGWGTITKKQGEVVNYGDSGSYSRYFDLDAWHSQFIITPKASTSERNKGLENSNGKKVNDGRKSEIDNPFQRGETIRQNTHPTVKPIKLMSYLITMGSRPKDLILDPFVGSGTTSIAALQLGRRYIGIEKEKEYVNIARKRLESCMIQTKLLNF